MIFSGKVQADDISPETDQCQCGSTKAPLKSFFVSVLAQTASANFGAISFQTSSRSSSANPSMSLQVIKYPHPTLRHRSKPIRRVDQELKSLAAEMLDLMYAHEGVGLAANQVDLPLRIFVCNPTGKRDEGEELVLINPLIQRPKGNEAAQEGCLSLPGMYGQVKRPKTVRLSAYDLQGNAIERTVDGFLARVIQHENDHLDGVLFFDRMTEEALREFDGQLAEFTADYQSQQKSGGIPSDDELIGRLAQWEQRYA